MPDSDRTPLAVQIQNEIVYSSRPISDVLRKAKILATLLGDPEFKRWTTSELSGYQSNDEVPDYRKFKAPTLGTFADYSGRIARNVPIAMALLPEELRKFGEVMTFRQGVTEIDAIRRQKVDYRSPWPAEALALGRIYFEEHNGTTLLEAWRPFTKPQMDGILDQVRNRLLDFLLELQQIDPDVMTSEAAIRAVARDTVQNVFHTKILGNENTVATGTHFTQTASSPVKAMDTRSLCDHLRSLGIPANSVASLQDALAEDGKRPQGQLGHSVKSWIARMTVKALDGTWSIALDTAASLLKKALFQYYGWP